MDSSSLNTLPIRSFINYLQLCYYYYYQSDSSAVPSYDTPKSNINREMIDQFRVLIDNNDQLIEGLYKIFVKSSNKKLLSNLVLTQRYHFKKFLPLNNDWISFNICLLTAYDAFLSDQVISILYQLYSQLKYKIYSGPIDAIESDSSYYSLNNKTIFHDQSILFHSIQLIVHIDSNAEETFLLNVTCLTCDTISQVKEKILQQVYLYKQIDSIPIIQCQLYLLTNVKSTNNSCSTSSCSSSTSSSSNVPLAKKSLLTQFFSNRTMKYSTTTTTTLTDPYKDSISLLLTDIDQTNEQMNQCKKLNTLQHYGIVHDGYELKMLLPKINGQNNYVNQINRSVLVRTNSRHYGNTSEKLFHYLPTLSILPSPLPIPDNDRIRYFHLLNHTYEEIGECGHLLMENTQSETYRLFETKSSIHSILINFIENLFTNFLQSDTYLSELIEQNSSLAHVFYGHFIPFIFQNLHCLFHFNIDKCLISSLEILATIFHIGCSAPSSSNEQHCSLCHEVLRSPKIHWNSVRIKQQ